MTPAASEAPAPAFSVIVPIAPGAQPLVFESLRTLEQGPLPCEVLSRTGPNPSRNRNESVAASRAEILAFTDDDCRVAPDWLARADAFFRAHPDYDAVGGPQLDGGDEGAVGRASGRALASWFGSGRNCRRYKRAAPSLAATQSDLTSANLFLTRRAFELWGPFDERLWPNEETALLGRIERAGGRIAYDPGIVVFHRRRPSLRGLARQCFGYGRGRARQSFLEGVRRPALAQAVPMLFVLYLGSLPVLAWLSGFWLAWLAPLAVYASAAAAVAAVSAWSEADPRAAALMPGAFFVIHTGYATGLLLETVRLAVRGPIETVAGEHPTIRAAAVSAGAAAVSAATAPPPAEERARVAG